jgi:hypothetical protein
MNGTVHLNTPRLLINQRQVSTRCLKTKKAPKRELFYGLLLKLTDYSDHPIAQFGISAPFPAPVAPEFNPE